MTDDGKKDGGCDCPACAAGFDIQKLFANAAVQADIFGALLEVHERRWFKKYQGRCKAVGPDKTQFTTVRIRVKGNKWDRVTADFNVPLIRYGKTTFPLDLLAFPDDANDWEKLDDEPRFLGRAYATITQDLTDASKVVIHFAGFDPIDDEDLLSFAGESDTELRFVVKDVSQTVGYKDRDGNSTEKVMTFDQTIVASLEQPTSWSDDEDD